MKSYRCYNCVNEQGRAGKDFDAAGPKCPHCGLSPAAGPRAAQMLVELAVIHFDPPTEFDQQGKNHAACDPKLRVGRPKHHFSGEPAAVTCRACKRTPEFRAAADERGLPHVPAELDVPLTVDPAAKTTRPTK